MSTLDVLNHSAMMKRAEQLKRWEESDTNRAAPTPRHENGRRIKFSSGCVFLAACLSGDKEDVVHLLENGADINTANVDGLTALHQACIDDKLEMVEFLIEHGADINRQDNEGWTPLHATASCGFVSIARYLVEKNADVAAVNSDGDLALDLAIDVQHMPMIDYMEKVVQELNIDVDQARKAEEQAMLNDAKKWLRSDAAEVDRPHPKTGATALHVAAAKGYTKVLSLLLAGRGNVDRQDNDGWTPLHAAAHWGQKETAEMLVESLADMDIRNYAGQSCIDVADRKMVKFLEELRANKRNKRRPSSQISRISDTIENHVDKTPTKLVRVEVRTDAVKDAAASGSQIAINDDDDDDDDVANTANQKDDDKIDVDDSKVHVVDDEESDSDLSDSTESSHSTSLDEESEAENLKPNHAGEHPVEEEAPWRRRTTRTPNDSPTKNQVPDKELSGGKSANESANDVILRRTQSFENDQKFYQKYNELRARIKANSCPILPATMATATATNNSAANINNNQSSNNNNSNNNNNNSNNTNNNNINNKSPLLLGKTASGSTSNTSTTTTFNTQHNTNNITTSTTTTAATNPSQLYSVQRSASLKDNSVYFRKPIAPAATTTTATPTTTTTTPTPTTPSSRSTSVLTPPIRRSFVPPVRDEESETQRKAHAKRVRETRRSTQGVTLDEIKSAEELVKKKNLGMNNNNNNNNNNSSSNETSSTSSTTTTTTATTTTPPTTTSTTTTTTVSSNSREDDAQPPPPPTTPPPAIIPSTTTTTNDDLDIIEAVVAPPTSTTTTTSTYGADTTASFTLSAPTTTTTRISQDNDDVEADDEQTAVSASFTIVSRRDKPQEKQKEEQQQQLKTENASRPTDLSLAESQPTTTTTTMTTTPTTTPATTPGALESPVRLRDKRSLSSTTAGGVGGAAPEADGDKSETASPIGGHPDFNARDSLLSLYAARRTQESGGAGGSSGAVAAPSTSSSTSTSLSAAERRPSWRLKFDAGSKFKLEDITSGGTYPPNQSTIIPSAPAVMAAVNLASTAGSQRRISSGPNALNASNQSLNSVGRPVSAPSESVNNSSAYVTPPARRYETSTLASSATGTTPTTTATTTASNASASPATTSANHDDKDNDKENDNRTQTVIQRRRKPKRRSTGVVHIDMDELDPDRQSETANNDKEDKDRESGSERTSRSRTGSTATTSTASDSKSSNSSDKAENGDGIDYKALWEAAKLENDKLKQMLKQKDDEIVQSRATLERFANATTKNSLSEIEKRERRAMERKLSELEEELKQLDVYKSDNHRLKEENAALIRVISKLSK